MTQLLERQTFDGGWSEHSVPSHRKTPAFAVDLSRDGMKRPITFDGCLGWFHQAPGTRGVVLCGTLGVEDLCTRQSWCLLADELAAAGLPTVRFDYHGTGNSTGIIGGSGQVETWIDNINAAANWLETHANITELVFVGFRFGATLATAAAQARRNVSRLVLLAPVPSGRTYARELQLAAKVVVPMGSTIGGACAADGALDVAGFVTHRDVLEDIKSVDLMRLDHAPAERILAVCTPGNSAEKKLVTHLGAVGATLTQRAFTDYAPMMVSPTGSDPCLDTIATVAAWLATDVPQHMAITMAPDHEVVLADPHWTERPQQFGPGQSLVGVLCEPEQPAATRPCVIILNSGRDSHIGWARSSVELARDLARSGIASLRFDMTCIGDSQPDRKGRRAALYSVANLSDVHVAIDHLERFGYRDVTLFAGCSGAYLAFHAALSDSRVKNVVLRNIQRFVWRLDDRIMFPLNEYLGKSRYSGTKGAPQSTVSRLIQRLRLTGICYRLGQPALSVLARVVSWLARDRARLKHAVARYSESGRRMLFVYGSTNEGRPYLDEFFGPDGCDIAHLRGIDIKFIDGADHNFTCARAREKLTGFVQSLVLAK